MDREGRAERAYSRCTIKSFKHNGSLHRMWLQNWQIPAGFLHETHAGQSASVFLNDQTPIVEADGNEWISRVPAVSFFLAAEWFNVVALLENNGIRYYCNIASPPYRYKDVLTYIDYDLDVMLRSDETVQELDRDEYERHRMEYRYGPLIEAKVEESVLRLRERMTARSFPFQDEIVRGYYEKWKKQIAREGDDER